MARPQSNQRGIETGHNPPLPPEEDLPQSNQRGIETWISGSGFSLNGISMFRPQSNQRGIETTTGCAITSSRTSPQSNQRGIETLLFEHHKRLQSLPQSNQRGIETGQVGLGSLMECQGLNRTSVGLKLKSPADAAWTSTQGLNRTSVGLKPRYQLQQLCRFLSPQSNQRGIETMFIPHLQS